MPTDQAKRERRAWGSLTREQIVQAALRVARSEGIDALSVRRLAAELGASRMALYRHVPSKEALLDLAAGALAAQDLEVLIDERADWETQLRRFAHEVRRQLGRYPGTAALLLRRGNASPAGLALAEHGIAILRRAGLDAAAAGVVYAAFFDVVLSRIHRETTAAGAGPEDRLREPLEAARRRPADELPHFTAALPALEALTADQVFATEVDLLIAGIRARAA